jgi:putative heme-binding domain-containing protein
VIQGQGGSDGPDLTDIGARRSAAYLKDALLRPGGASPDGYLIVTARLRDGREVSGRRLNEDSFTIQLRDSREGLHSLRKSDLAELRKEFGKSEMPSYESLSSSEIDDLIAYLSSLRGVK